jgi:hypothetical protein
MRKRRTAVVVAAAALTLVFPTASQARQPSGTPPADPVEEDHFTPLVASVLNQPDPVLAADGRIHLAYELLVINPLPEPITVTRIEVVDTGHRDRVLADFSGPSLAAALSPFVPDTGPAVGGGTAHRAILDVSLPATARPRSLAHRITVAEVPVPVLANPFPAAPTEVSADRAVVLAPPLAGAGWIDLGGCCGPGSHRNAVMPLNGGLHVGQRFAVDITRIGPDGRLFTGSPDLVTSFPAYGVPVLAAAAGVVVQAQDDQTDQIPFQATPPGEPRTILGNAVIVDIGHGRYTAYAHLKPHSVRVAAGDRVRAGQQLGLLGNSGNSDLPHLHFQVMDSPSPLAGNGLPFVFRSFDSPGSIPPLDQIDITEPIPVGVELAGHHEQVIPMDRQVMTFPQG